MRSPAEARAGRGVPGADAVRAMALVALALAWWGQGGAEPSAMPGPGTVRGGALDGAGGARALADSARAWLQGAGAAEGRGAAPVAGARTLLVRTIPDASARALLGTLAAAGAPVGWHDASGAAGGALQLERLPGPGEVLEARAVAGVSGALVLRDRGGMLDSLMVPPGAVQGWRLDAAGRAPTVTLAFVPRGAPEAAPPASVPGASRTPWPAPPPSAAQAGAPPPRAPGVVRILARPGWEAKFTAAALEEAGWQVEGRWAVSPVAEVTLGLLAPLDTARHAAVVVLDSAGGGAGTPDAALRRFVEAGGGLVLAGDGLRWPGARALAAATATAARPAAAGALQSMAPREGLARWRLVPVPGAQRLAGAADGTPVLVAHTAGRGRAVAMAYRDSWRWRMAGGDEGMAAHRQWWDAVVRLAAGTAPGHPAPAAHFPGDGAPWLDLVSRLGPPAPPPLPLRGAGGERGGAPATVARRVAGLRMVALRVVALRAGAGRHGGALFVAAAALLLLEWGARRRRGHP